MGQYERTLQYNFTLAKFNKPIYKCLFLNRTLRTYNIIRYGAFNGTYYSWHYFIKRIKRNPNRRLNEIRKINVCMS